MATLELDPLFTKALKLLHSKSKDSEYQLRLMVEDVIGQRKGHPVKHDLSESPSEPKKQRLDLFAALEKEEKSSKERERERDKDKEKPRKERDVKEKDDKERKEKISEKAAAAAEKAAAMEKSSAKDRESQDSSDDNIDTDGFAVDLGIACTVCKQFDVTSGNQLIECQECHNLYHQECHKPPVTGQDVNDPRFVWYCTRCVKNLEKMIPSSSMAAKPMSGLVGLAANLSGKTTSDVLSKSSLTKSEQTKHSSSSSSSSSKESKSSSSKADSSEKSLFAAALTMGSKGSSKGQSKTSSGIQMANADKRLQMMKKKAAAKLQEKRALLK